ncbi:general transcription factor 3C polypeptide 6 [Echeneis naucrates]|uniref:General transcription factor 3C polypeptide 6 n=1 Tax=Echeneis naucrates TaxID=173247 RepID=A0A665VFB0_ECHNA|nr:general transcription factor 3C polypeptide 6 [Echeneis naucrates]
MEDEWEEEEQLVVVELSGIISNDFLSKCRGTCKILDIDSEKPMMQVGQHVFAGEYEDALGTCVLFEEGPQKKKSDSNPELKYKCHTVKKLMMQRIFLTDKKEGETSTAYGGGEEQKETTNQTIKSHQQENDDQQQGTEGKTDSTDLENSAVG